MLLKLEIEPIPEKNWGLSLAHLLPKPVWDTVRREVYSRSKYTCDICYKADCRVNCHEVWGYNDTKHTQFFSAFECLCDDCHNVKHWGRTVAMVHKGELPNNYLQVLSMHFCKVNDCTPMDFLMYRTTIGDKQQYRNQFKYTLDFGKFTPEHVVQVWLKKQKGKR